MQLASFNHPSLVAADASAQCLKSLVQLQSHILSDAFALQLRGKCSEVIDKLRAIGLDKLISLPSIVVCEDTSSGKSSLPTSTSVLNLSSNSGRTTWRPIEVILTKSHESHAMW